MSRHTALPAVLLAAVLWLPGAQAASVAAPAAAAQHDTSRMAAHNKQLVDTAFKQWAAGGSGLFDTLLASDVTWTIEGSGPFAGTVHGRDALVDKAVRPLASRLSTPLRPLHWQLWADGVHVIVQWEGVATARDGAPYRNRYAWIMRMRDDKVVEVNAFLDLPHYTDVLQRIPDTAARAGSP